MELNGEYLKEKKVQEYDDNVEMENPLRSEAIAYITLSPDERILHTFQTELKIPVSVISPYFISDNFLENHNILILDFRKDQFDILSLFKKCRSLVGNQILVLLVSPDGCNPTLLNMANDGLDYFYMDNEPVEELVENLKILVRKRQRSRFCHELKEIHSSTLREKLEWLTYKNSLRNIGHDSYGRNLIKNLRYSLTQGGGFGIILSLIEMSKEFSAETGENYIIPKNIMDMLYDNSEFARKSFSSMDSILNLLTCELDQKSVKVSSFLFNLQRYLSGLDDFLQTKNIALNFPQIESYGNYAVDVDEGLFQMAIEEIVLNAAKYSRKGSCIDIYLNILNGYMCIFVKNEADEVAKTMPDNFTEQLVSPFFRYHPPYEDTIAAEKFMMGLGLTAVNYILSKHNCIFSITKVSDHTGSYVKPCILVQIHLPISGQIQR